MMYVTGAQNTAAVVATGNNTETALVSSPVIDIGRDAAFILVTGFCFLTTGATTTFITPRVRRGADITGVLIGVATAITIVGAVGSTSVYMIQVVDQAGPFATVQYTFTCQATAATANFSAPFSSVTCQVQA